jgi:hypothetical protein
VTFTETPGGGAKLVHKWDPSSDEPVLMGTLAAEAVWEHWVLPGVDPEGDRLAYAHDDGIYLQQLDSLETSAPRLIGRHEGGGIAVLFHPVDEVVMSASPSTGEIRFWSLAGEPDGESSAPTRTLQDRPMTAQPRFDPTGRYLATGHDKDLAAGGKRKRMGRL